MNRFLDLLNSVKKSNNSTFHSCEPELIELMRQIDEMIELKNQEWKSDVDDLECQLHQALSEKGILAKDVETLKAELLSEKKLHSQTLLQYEKDVKQLKNDMSKLKKRYFELQKKIDHSNKKKIINLDGKSSSSFDTLKTLMSEGKHHKNTSSTTETQRKSDILLLNLKSESLLIENNNLRALLKEQSKPIFENRTPTSTLCSQAADPNDFPPTDANNVIVNDTLNSTCFEIPKPKSSSREHPLSNSSHVSGSMNMEYFDGDHSLEDKLNDILAQFETVSSSMVLS